MIRLSDRLRRIAEDINKGETMADIGTDHGFLPVYLLESGTCPRVIMTDISAASLEKAIGCVRMHGVPTDADSFRTGDGLSVLKPFEVDTVVIAGMGGKLIRDIMSADMELTCSFRKFILQPRIGQGHLRKWLIENGFHIVREGLVYEGRHIPEIITVMSPSCDDGIRPISRDEMERLKRLPAESVSWRTPPWMIYADGPVEAFLSRSISREKLKLNSMRMARQRNTAAEVETEQNITYLNGLMKEYKNGKQQRNVT